MRRTTLMPLIQTKELEDFFNVLGTFNTNEKSYSHSFLKESKDAFYASMDMPGVNGNDINVELKDGVLKVSGERKTAFDKDSFKYEQQIVLPENIDAEKIEAHYENGVLSLAIPKVLKESDTVKKIPVNTGAKKNWFLN